MNPVTEYLSRFNSFSNSERIKRLTQIDNHPKILQNLSSTQHDILSNALDQEMIGADMNRLFSPDYADTISQLVSSIRSQLD